MIQIYQEANLPKLSETSLYNKFNESSKITENVKAEISNSAGSMVKPEEIKEILSLIRLNGDNIVKKAVDAYMAGNIVIIFNKASSRIPQSLPYIVMGYKGKPTAFIFADKVINNINSTSEYTALMAVMEAAYLALMLNTKQSEILMNSQLMLTLCNVYTLMVIKPLEQRLYMKGDNLNKAMIYIISYFYQMFRGDDTLTADSIPYKRIMNDKIDDSTINSILDDVMTNEDRSFIGLLKMMSKINPIRYKDMDAMYLTYFTSLCGIPLIFALENIAYLFMLVTSSTYKTSITDYGLNKIVSIPAKKALLLLSNI